MDIVASPNHTHGPNTLDDSLVALISANLAVLNSAQRSIHELPADKYNYIASPYFESCFGKHMRHILDHYLCFIRDFDSGVIDYEQRNRNSQLETDREYTLSVIHQVCEFFEGLLANSSEDKALQVVLCSDIEHPDGEVGQSSMKRELQFLHGHTVHHYALISVMMKFYGIPVSPDFGVAPSTLAHQETVKVSA